MSLWPEKHGSALLSSVVFFFFKNAITCCPHLALNANNKEIHDQPLPFLNFRGNIKMHVEVCSHLTHWRESITGRNAGVIFILGLIFKLHMFY